MTAPILHDAWIDRARAVAVEDELARRGHHLKRQGQELVGPCPLCGGTDRFGVHLIRQMWNCRGCNVGGDVISLVRHLDGCSFGAATETLIGAHRQLPVIAQKRATKPSRIEPATSTEAALRLWDEARPIPGTLAARYLAHRGISDLPPEHEEVLRFHPRCVFGHDADNRSVHHPCMLALVRDAITNEPKAVYRTALMRDGIKVGRMAYGPVRGGAIKLWPDEYVGAGLVIGEGVETTLAAATCIEHRATLLQPAWAVVAAGNMATFPVLSGIEALTVLVDNDANGAGQNAAATCARRWQSAGREVTRLTINKIGADFNDAVRA